MGTRKYRSTTELEARIDAYFERCAEEKRPPTVHGLALALGFATAEALRKYRGKPSNREAVQRALTRLGQYAEEKLLRDGGGAGARYVLERGLAAGVEDDEGAADVMAEVRRRLRRRDEA